MKKKRLRKKETPPDVWIAHKKARKKIASAKWYARIQSVRVHNRKETQIQQKEREETERKEREQKFSHDMFECRWQHHVNHWPPRPPDIPAADWVALLKLAEQSLQYVVSLPMINKQPEKIGIFRRLCMSELEDMFRGIRKTRDQYKYDDPIDEEAIAQVTQRMRTPSLSSSSSSVINTLDNIKHHNGNDDEPSSSSKWWDQGWMGEWRKRLVGNAFPWTATWLGVVLADVLFRGQSHRWPGLLKYMYQLSHTNPSALPNHEGQNVIMHNPSHIPQRNPM